MWSKYRVDADEAHLRGNHALALQLYTSALTEAHSFGSGDARLVGTYNDLGLEQQQLGQATQAATSFNAAITAAGDNWKSSASRQAIANELARAHYGLGESYAARRMLDAAIASYRASLDLQKTLLHEKMLDASILTPEERVRTLSGLASALRERSSTGEASALYAQCIALCNELPGMSRLRRQLEAQWHGEKDFPRPQDMKSGSQADQREFERRWNDMVAQAVGLNKAGETAAALTKFQKALRYAQSRHNDNFAAQNKQQIGQCFILLGKPGTAEKWFRLALADYLRLNGPYNCFTAIVMKDLADSLAIQQKFKAAEPFYRRALEINGRLLPSSDIQIRIGLQQYAHVLRRLGQIEKAMKVELKLRAIEDKRNLKAASP